MAKAIIELRLDRELDNAEMHNLRQLFKDAFGEFVEVRADAESYVARRYIDQSDRFKRIKVLEVEQRTSTAHALKRAEVSYRKVEAAPVEVEMTVDEASQALCARGACNNSPALWWNTSTLAYYCGDCALKINAHAPGLCIKLTPKNTRPKP